MSYEFHFEPHQPEGQPEIHPHADDVQRWARAWSENFRKDAPQVDLEVRSLCNRIRTVLDSIEGKTI